VGNLDVFCPKGKKAARKLGVRKAKIRIVSFQK
jgi:hypothetical protein